MVAEPCPAIVVGAGPAGSAAAAVLRSEGRSVRLLDMASERDAGQAERATVFHAEPGRLWNLHGDEVEPIWWDVLVLATGDMPALMPTGPGQAWQPVGRVPDNRLAAALGCAHAYDHARGWLLPVRDANLMSSMPGVFLPGAVAGSCDPADAARQGEIVARAICAGTDQPGPPRSAPIDEVSYDDEAARAATIPDDTLVCPCMQASARQVREAARAGADTLYRLGHLSLAGSGACRGRQCHFALAALIESVTGRARADILTLPFEFPAVEVPLRAFVELTPERPPAAALQQDRGTLR